MGDNGFRSELLEEPGDVWLLDPGEAAVSALHGLQSGTDRLEFRGGRLVVWRAEKPVNGHGKDACPASVT